MPKSHERKVKEEINDPLMSTSRLWNPCWDTKKVSIDAFSVDTIKKAHEILQYTDESGVVQKKGHPLDQINIGTEGLRFVVIIKTPDQENDKFKIELAVGLGSKNKHKDKFIEVFGHEHVCKANKKSVGVVHKELKRHLGIKDDDVLGGSFYFNKKGEITAANRSGQNEAFFDVNKLAKLLLIQEVYEMDPAVLKAQLPIRIAKKFSNVDIEKALRSECILLQKTNDEYFIHYSEKNKLKSIKIDTIEQIGPRKKGAPQNKKNVLDDLNFDQIPAIDLTKYYVNHPNLSERHFKSIHKYIMNKTRLTEINQIPDKDNIFFFNGARVMPRDFFEPLLKNGITCINKKIPKTNFQVLDKTNYEKEIEGYNANLLIWKKLQNSNKKNDPTFMHSAIARALLKISSTDITSWDHHEHDFIPVFIDALSRLDGMVNIYKQKYDDKLSQNLAKDYYELLKGTPLEFKASVLDGLGKDKLSIKLNEQPIWLSLYLVAFRNNNEPMLRILEEKLLSNKKNNQDIVTILKQGLAYAKQKENPQLFWRFKNLLNDYNPDYQLIQDSKSLIDNPPKPKYSIQHMLTTYPNMLQLSSLNGWALTTEDFLYFSKQGVTDFSGTTPTGIDFSKIEVKSNFKFVNATLTCKQLLDLHNKGINNFEGVVLEGILMNINFNDRKTFIENIENINLKDIKLSYEQAITLNMLLSNTLKGKFLKNILNGLKPQDQEKFIKNIPLSGVKLTKKLFLYFIEHGRTNFTGAILDKLDLSDEKLTGIDFTGASIVGTDFSNAILERCIFTRAKKFDTKFYGTKFINTAKQECPSLVYNLFMRTFFTPAPDLTTNRELMLKNIDFITNDLKGLNNVIKEPEEIKQQLQEFINDIINDKNHVLLTQEKTLVKLGTILSTIKKYANITNELKNNIEKIDEKIERQREYINSYSEQFLKFL